MNSVPGSEYILAGIFILFIGAAIAGALLAVFTTKIIRSVCGLALTSVGLAGMYYFLNSPFLALMEILIYVGAVVVTIVFAIMLAEPYEIVDETHRHSVVWSFSAIVVSGAIFWSLARLGLMGDWQTPAIRLNDGTIEDIGVSLLTTYSMAFEVISLVLLVAIIGALAIARTGRHHHQ